MAKQKSEPKVSKRPLNDILKDFIMLEETADPETGELNAELCEKLSQELSDKSDAIGYYILLKQKEIEATKIMADSYKLKAQSKQKKLDNYKKFISRAVRQFGEIEISGENENKWFRGGVIGLKDISGDDIEIIEPEKIPDPYLEFVTTLSNDEKKIVQSAFPKLLINFKPKPANSLIKEAVLIKKKKIPGVEKVFREKITVTGLTKINEEKIIIQ